MLSKVLVILFTFFLGVTEAWAVVGGQESREDEGVYQLKVSSRNGGVIRCSGVAVANHVLLTAAHCVAVGLVGYGAKIEVFQKGQTHMKVERTYVDPDFIQNDIPSGSDLALLIIKENFSNPLRIRRDEFKNVDALTIIGYGLSQFNDRKGESGGRQRKAKLIVKGRGDMSILVGDDKKAACYGDSGAPLLHMGQVVGIMSHGTRGYRV